MGFPHPFGQAGGCGGFALRAHYDRGSRPIALETQETESNLTDKNDGAGARGGPGCLLTLMVLRLGVALFQRLVQSSQLHWQACGTSSRSRGAATFVVGSAVTFKFRIFERG